MSFQAYLDNIKAKTGMTPADFHAAAIKKNMLGADYTATKFVEWLAADYGLGRGHAMAIVQAFKYEGWLATPAKKTKPAAAAKKR
ncbi:MAG: DUF4287 domain-containing protein [Rhodoblastus sp.]